MMFSRIRRSSDDEGLSLLLVIGFGLVATSLMIVGTTIADRSLVSSRAHSHFEGALAAAENGVDEALARAQKVYNLTGGDTYVTPSGGITGDPTPDCVASTVTWSSYPMPPEPTAAQERTFAKTVLTGLPSGCVHVTEHGDYSFFKPAGRQTVYAIGWFPHKNANEVKTRILKAEYLFVPYRPQHAILASGPVALGSSTTVTSAPPNDPALAAVHSNSTVTVETGNPTVYGPVTATGGSSGGSNNFMSNPGGVVTTSATVRVPAVSAAAVWAKNRATNPPGGWYDLCADGHARSPDGATPCAGTDLGSFASGGAFRGWSYNSGTSPVQWIAGSGLKSNGYSGTYYVNGADAVNNASNTGAPVPNLTVIASASTTTCNKVGGNITWSQTDAAAPSTSGLWLLADQDILTTSNYHSGSDIAGTVVSGMFIAGDQIQMETSSAGAYGAVIAADQCDPADGASLVDSSFIKNPAIYYDPNAQAPFVDIINTTLWLEYVG